MAYVIGRTHTEAIQASLDRAILGAPPDDSLAGLMRAALIGHTAAVSVFLDHGVPVNAVDSSGRSPLIEAVFGGHLDTVEELLKRGADVNARDNDGWTALMEAASKGRANLVRTLIAHGADARIRNRHGWTALKTTSKCNAEVNRMLRDAGAS
ncbi:MAG TPA: ankyrin repeat domain-containing protein [Blastocatellia bacterium]|nr:ankyrin repeat domain-containing protein [Blastocatellia bacterium]